jgi:RNA polymerase sigma factor (TIGR02999 family)
LKENAVLWEQGQLTDTLYHELRTLAAIRLSHEHPSNTLQATALVHEAWLRLGADQQPEWVNRAHFFSAAAEAMRRILVDAARRRKAVRHGGNQKRVDADVLERTLPMNESTDFAEDSIIDLQEALKAFSQVDSETADLVKLHYYAGLTHEDIVNLSGLSRSTVVRRLAFARAWLRRQMEQP